VKARLQLASVIAILCVSSPAFAAPVLVDAEKGVAVNLGVFLQPWFQLTAPAVTNGGSPDIGAPDGSGPSFDFFLRRVRLMAFGSVTKNLSFFIETDQPNFGKGGNFNTSMFIQDAFLTYTFSPAFRVDAGMLLVPFSRHTIEGAIGLHALDYHGDLIRLPAGKVWRDTGVQIRGLLLDDRLHYRLGVFEGVRNSAAPTVPIPPPAAGETAPTPLAPLNENGLPRITAQVRYNLVGTEGDFFLKGIYFSPTPLISIGLGVDYQPGAVYHDIPPGTGPTFGTLPGNSPQTAITPGDYVALSLDAFVEYPFSADDELIAKANLFYYGEGSSRITGTNALPNGGTGFFVEAGFRHGWIEPLAFLEYLRGDDNTLEIVAPHVGVNFWVTQHNFNLKADVGYRKTDTLRGATIETDEDILGTIQAQLYF
jgi:hypothetical protein